MEEQEEDQSQKQSSDEQDEAQQDSESEQSQTNLESDLKYWRSTLIKDGSGPFLQPHKLKDKVAQISLRNGLAE